MYKCAKTCKWPKRVEEFFVLDFKRGSGRLGTSEKVQQVLGREPGRDSLSSFPRTQMVGRTNS